MTTIDLRYPVGRFARPTTFTGESRAAAIAAIAAAPAQLRAAVHGLSDAQLDTPYRPGGWTVRQVVHHVADSHLNAYVRVRLGITEDNPAIKPYEEAKWAELADAKTLPVGVSLSLLEALHERWATLLRSMPAAQFSRSLMHPETGPTTIDGMLEMYAWHARHHTAHITALRQRNGW